MRSVAATLRRPTFEWLTVTLLCVSLAVLAAMEGWLWRIDQSVYDSVLATWTHPPGDDVVIISIDDASLSEIGRWPWSRRTHAALIDLSNLALLDKNGKATRVGFRFEGDKKVRFAKTTGEAI